nr:MAG TPA: hypothetical protein [Caudoviricetes sp.]
MRRRSRSSSSGELSTGYPQATTRFGGSFFAYLLGSQIC